MPTVTRPADFLPATPAEIERLGWDRPDVILVTGDTYIDSPYAGAAVIGRVLQQAGWRVAIVAQPDVSSGRDIAALGEPALFWGVTGGCVDSLVANYTASGKRRKSDDMTPGGVNDRRPDRAVIAYANLIRRHFKQTRPIVLGGIEASLRRISHYDAWSKSVRRAILFDAKADVLVYGMGEETILELAAILHRDGDLRAAPGVRGICYIARDIPTPEPSFPAPDIVLPAHAEVRADPAALSRMFQLFYANTDPVAAARLVQRQDTRYLVQTPPRPPLSPEALEAVYELPYTLDVHPSYARQGRVTALDTIRFSLTTHRGCYGECRFCAITVHQGRRVVSRSRESLLREAASFARHPEFKGIVADVGGPTANMYGFECGRKTGKGACPDRACLFPSPCEKLPVRHAPLMDLLAGLRALPGVRKVFVRSGVRYDLVLADRKRGAAYLREMLRHHVSGQMKIAPEHTEDEVLRRMGKPGRRVLEDFLRLFESARREVPNKLFLTYYFMAAHPGCTLEHMRRLSDFARRRLRLSPEQVQIFTPTPSTYSTLMYATGRDPLTGEPLFVERDAKAKERQKAAIIQTKRPKRRKR